jgi:hypothetical protein
MGGAKSNADDVGRGLLAMTLEEFFRLPIGTKLRSTINGHHYVKISPTKYQKTLRGLEEELTQVRVYRALGCPDRQPPIYDITDERYHSDETLFCEVIDDDPVHP